jgi:hypothetical protein
MTSRQSLDLDACHPSLFSPSGTPLPDHPIQTPVQVVGYESVPDPALLLAEDGEVTRIGLAPGTELDYSLGERHCAGVVQNGNHDPCPNPGAPYCETHTVPWSVANNADSDEEHVVYLAAFAPDVFKVGVTRTWRLETRLREQGADRGARAFTVADGRIAREVESDVNEDDRLTEWVRVPAKVAGLHREVDERAWAALVEEFDVGDDGRFAFDYGLGLTDQPVPETLLAGTVRGVKGRVLVLDRAGTTYAVDMRDLVGHELEEEDEERDLQSSLGAFG